MSGLNWEAERRKQMPRDPCVDAPPLTGSYQDRLRYGAVYHGTRRDESATPGIVHVIRPSDDVRQLQAYLFTIGHADFKRKNPTQRNELLKGLRTILNRCLSARDFHRAEHEHLLAQAQKVLPSWLH